MEIDAALNCSHSSSESRVEVAKGKVVRSITTLGSIDFLSVDLGRN